MGVVYLAEQERPFRRRVALKVIKVGMDTREVVARFEAERQALALMDHPNIAQVHDAGATEDGRPFFVMEHVPGIAITDYCDKHRLSTRARLELFVQVCGAVQHAHQKGVIHRDIKPSNVLVMVQDGKLMAKVIDFGVAKAIRQRLTEKTVFTQFGLLIGTPEYMSPEQAEMSGLDVDATTDIYSLGVVLYELLIGALPFDPARLRHAGYGEIQRIIREEEPARPSRRLSGLGAMARDIASHRQTELSTLQRELQGDLDWITLKAMEKDRTARYASASELAGDVNRHLNSEAVLARPSSASYRLRKFVRKHRLGVAAGALVIAALTTGLMVSALMYVRAEAARRGAERQAYAAALAAIQTQIIAVEAVRDNPTSSLSSAAFEALRALSAVPERWRGWEWKYLAGTLDGSSATLYGSAAGGMDGPRDPFTEPRYQGPLGVSADGDEIFWGTGLGVHAWKVSARRLSGAWPGFGEVRAIAGDGLKLLSVNPWLPAPWRIIETKTGRTIATLPERDADAYTHCTFSRDGQLLVTSTRDGSTAIWDATSGQRRAVTRLPVWPAFAAFARDKPVLLLGGGTDLFMWHFLDSAVPQRFAGSSNTVLMNGDIAASGSMAVSIDNGGIIRWWRLGARASSGELGEHKGASVISLTADGRLAATGSTLGAVRLWNVDPGRWPVTSVELDLHQRIRLDAVRFTPDENDLIAASSLGVLNVWNVSRARLARGVLTGPLVGLGGSIAETGRVAVLPEPGQTTLLDLDTLQPVAALRVARDRTRPDFFSHSAVSSDGKAVLLGHDDGTVLLWRPGNSPQPTDTAPGELTALAISPDGNRAAAVWVASRSDSSTESGATPPRPQAQLRVWEVRSRSELLRFDADGPLRSVAFDRSGNLLLVTQGIIEPKPDCQITTKVFDLSARKLRLELADCASVAIFVSGGTRIVTRSQLDKRIRMLDSRTGSVLLASEPIGTAWTLAASPDGLRLAIGTAAGIRIFELGTLTSVLTIPADTATGLLQFSLDGLRLIQLSGAGVRVFDSRHAYSPDVRLIVSQLGSDGRPPGSGFWPVEDLVDRVRLNASMNPALREAVVDELERFGDRDVVALCHEGRQIVTRQNETRQNYERALRRLSRATTLAPWSAYCVGMLGTAKFRLGDDAGALETLAKAATLRIEPLPIEPLPSELAVTAMALHRLGRTSEAAAVAGRLKLEVVTSTDDDLRRFVVEMESVLQSAPATLRPAK
jgi:WD40 repeat protein